MISRCVNIDWLEVFVEESNAHWPCNADYFRERGYEVREREYGTRVYAEMFTICDTLGYPAIEVRRRPYSTMESNTRGFFSQFSSHIRLSNRACYMQDPIGFLREFLLRHDYHLKSIYRIDICLDFEKFDKGDDPAKVMQRYMTGKYSKINQANVSAHGKDRWEKREFNSLSWGAPKSMVGTKFYNKSLELTEARDKPYIRQAWMYAGLIDDIGNMAKRKADGTIYKPVIWRVEFSIKASAKRVFIMDVDKGRKKARVAMPHTLDVYDNKERLLCMFASLAQHYFHFKKYREGRRKDRCEDKVLFQFSQQPVFYKLDHLASDARRNRDVDVLLSRLRRFRLTQTDAKVREAAQLLIDTLERMNLRATLDDPYDRRQFEILQQIIGLKVNNGVEAPVDVLMRELNATSYDGY